MTLANRMKALTTETDILVSRFFSGHQVDSEANELPEHLVRNRPGGANRSTCSHAARRLCDVPLFQQKPIIKTKTSKSAFHRHKNLTNIRR